MTARHQGAQRPGAEVAAFARDTGLALAVLIGKVDRSDPAIPAHLAIARSRHLGSSDLCDLIDRAISAHAVALGRDLVAVDRAFLRAARDGGVNLLDNDVFARLAPIYKRRSDDPEMLAMLAVAAEAFSDAALDAAGAMLASDATWEAINRVQRPADY